MRNATPRSRGRRAIGKRLWATAWKENRTRMQSPKRGDVVWVNLDPTVGAEMQKRRPCVVVSLSVLNEKRLTVVVVPLSTASTPRPPLGVAGPSAGAASNARIDQ